MQAQQLPLPMPSARRRLLSQRKASLYNLRMTSEWAGLHKMPTMGGSPLTGFGQSDLRSNMGANCSHLGDALLFKLWCSRASRC